MPLQIIKENLEPVSQLLPLGVSGFLILGLPVEDWIVLGTAIVVTGNIVFMVLRLKDRFYGSR